MGIKRIVNPQDAPKLTPKSIRLRDKGTQALGILSKVGDLSQNEVLNVLLEEALDDYNFLQQIKKHFENGTTEVQCYKNLGLRNIHFRITVKPDLRCKLVVVDEIGDQGGNPNVFEEHFSIEKISELVDFGVDSSFSIFTK